jgi:hypothetical protein
MSITHVIVSNTISASEILYSCKLVHLDDTAAHCSTQYMGKVRKCLNI